MRSMGLIIGLALLAMTRSAGAQPPDIVVYPDTTTATIKAMTAPAGVVPDQVCLVACDNLADRSRCVPVGSLSQRVDFEVDRPIGTGDACYQAVSGLGAWFSGPSNRATVPDLPFPPQLVP